MTLLVVGTVAFDSVETPYAKRERAIGGSATYFAVSASSFTPTRLIGVVGTDFPAAELERMRALGIDTDGVEVVDGKSFFWAGRYEADWNTRHTLETQLNVFADFEPKIPDRHRDTPYVFLANAAPAIQLHALEQCREPKLVVADTMNLWIETTREDLDALLRRVDGVVLNDEEARMLSGERNLVRAAHKVLESGPRFLILKKGEHGAFLVGEGIHFALPAYPVDEVVDPTGAGDSFAGGFMGYLASVGNFEPANLRRAMAYGTVTASFCVQDFSIDELLRRRRPDVERRFNELLSMVSL